MDKQTQEYYKNNAIKLYDDYIKVEDGISKFFPYIFQKDDKVLDIGSASGRDLLKLLELGINAIGIEPCLEFRNIAISKNPKLVTRLIPSLPNTLDIKFDGIICSAVLMHLDDNDTRKMISFITDHIRENGNVLISVPLERSDIKEDNRDKAGRLFILRIANDYIDRFTKNKFVLINKWKNEDGLNRSGCSWINLLFKKKPEPEEDRIYFEYH